jgi:hypothetical protein
LSGFTIPLILLSAPLSRLARNTSGGASTPYVAVLEATTNKNGRREFMTAIPDDWVEEVRSGDLSGPPPHDPLDWLGEECLRLDGLGALVVRRFYGRARGRKARSARC